MSEFLRNQIAPALSGPNTADAIPVIPPFLRNRFKPELTGLNAAHDLRENLAGRLSAAQGELSANVIELRGSGGDPELIGRADAQLGALMALKAQLDRASPAALASISTQIAQCVASAADLAQRAQAVNAERGTQAAGDLATGRQAARASVGKFADAYFGRRIFDPYLEFDSEEERDAFIRRKEVRRREIEKAQALNSPEGDLHALDVSIAQLEDAGVHGADRSPEFQPMLTDMKKSRHELVTRAKGSAAAEHDRPDPLSDEQRATDVPLDLVASFQAAGISGGDAVQRGHGVARLDRTVPAGRNPPG